MRSHLMVPLLCSLMLNAIFGSLYFLIPETKFAPGYTQEKFAAISCGISEGKVREILGDPISIVPSGSLQASTLWIYSVQANQLKGYDFRAIEMSERGEVVRMIAEKIQD